MLAELFFIAMLGAMIYTAPTQLAGAIGAMILLLVLVAFAKYLERKKKKRPIIQGDLNFKVEKIERKEDKRLIDAAKIGYAVVADVHAEKYVSTHRTQLAEQMLREAIDQHTDRNHKGK